MARKMKLVLLLLLLTTSRALAAPREYPCYRLSHEPTLDGKIDDAAWKDLPEATGFYKLSRNDFVIERQTHFKAGWSKDALYLAIRCDEPNPDKLKASTSDCDVLWEDDSVELFFVPPGVKTYLQFISNCSGARWNGEKGEGTLHPWNWQAKTSIDSHAWYLEARIPFTVMRHTPKTEERWPVNVARDSTTGYGEERLTCWPVLKKAFNEVNNFAVFVFKNLPPNNQVMKEIENKLNTAYSLFTERNREEDRKANLIVNGSFEEGKISWGTDANHHPDLVTLDEMTSTDGKRSLRLSGSTSADLFIDANQSLKLKPSTSYLLKVDIKRTMIVGGNTSVAVLERGDPQSEWTFHWCGQRMAKGAVFGEWQHFETPFKTNAKASDSLLILYNAMSGATAWFDNIQLMEVKENSNAVPMKSLTTILRFELKCRDAIAKVIVNGRELVAENQALSTEMREGLSVITIAAEARGQDPGVILRTVGHPETEGRWRVGTKTEDQGLTSEFNDSKWPVVKVDAEGFMWNSDKKSTTACFRQVLLWNEKHDGPNRCINPLVKEWGFSERSVETLFLALYSPLPFPMDDYEFILDLPQGFRLIDKPNRPHGNLLNRSPRKIVEEQVQHEGHPYNRYRIAYPPEFVAVDQVSGSLLPVQAGDFKGSREILFFFRYHRSAHGNFTELEQTIPVRVLPPINGRMPKRVMISQYSPTPWGYSQLTPEHLEAHLQQSLKTGFNYWIMGAPLQTHPYEKVMYDKVTAGGAHIVLCSDSPFYGDKGPWSHGHLLRWLEATPEARVRYFKNSVTWDKVGMYCPQYVTNEGAAGFREAVKKEYQDRLAGLPKAEIIWSDWESAPWVGASIYESALTGDGSWCFCDRCKLAFRAFAQLPDTTDLSDETIFKKYKVQWAAFRSLQDGQIVREVRKVSNELGKPYMMYSWMAHTRFWEACKGNIDLAFPGCPGNPVADSYEQKGMDDAMTFFRQKVGLPRAMGQRFSFFFYYTLSDQKDSWKRWVVLSEDGYVHPKSWKTQVLRIVTAFHGGVDLQSSMECVAGMKYYIGEATRIISEYESLFYNGERADYLASSPHIGYPNLLVLKKDKERLILLFNENTKPLRVSLNNKDLQRGQHATVFETNQQVKNPEKMQVTIPPEDVAVVYIK